MSINIKVNSYILYLYFSLCQNPCRTWFTYILSWFFPHFFYQYNNIGVLKFYWLCLLNVAPSDFNGEWFKAIQNNPEHFPPCSWMIIGAVRPFSSTDTGLWRQCWLCETASTIHRSMKIRSVWEQHHFQSLIVCYKPRNVSNITQLVKLFAISSIWQCDQIRLNG